jgi:hypothetical protein
VIESASVIFVGSKISKFFVSGEVRLSAPNAKDLLSPPPSGRFKVKNFEALEQLAPNLNFLAPVGPGEYELKEGLFQTLQSTPAG